MAYGKPDQMKQSFDSLEKYRLFTENKLKLFICKEFDQRGSLLRKIMLEREMYHILAQLPLTVEKRSNWFHFWFLHFSWIEHSSETIKASKLFTLISFFWNRYEKDI